MLRWAEIHLSRLLKNYGEIKKLSGKKRVFAVVKANAYGHGSVEISKFLEKNTDVHGFAVATFEEGVELREGGITREILVMASNLKEGLEAVREFKLTPVVFDFEDLELAKHNRLSFHIKVDTGMGRLGFLPNEFGKLLTELRNSNVTGIMSHFSSADEDREFTERQFKLFKNFAARVKAEHPNVSIHIDNSAALPFRLDSLLTHCRVGLALYGVKPYPNFPANLEQVMEVKARVISVKELPPDFPVSYGRSYITEKKEKVAVIGFGYADGLTRSLSNKGAVVINGRRCPIRGRICMDMTVVSVEETDVRKGEIATIIGKDIPFEEIAAKAGTIPYEVMCDISQRVKRIYIV